MNRRSAAALAGAVVCLPAALIVGGFNGLSALGSLLAIVAISAAVVQDARRK